MRTIFNYKDETENVRYLMWKLERGAEKLGVDLEGDYEKRVKHEVDVIKKAGFVDYFLIIEDIMSYCSDVGIARGPGRGSGAGSMVCYLLGITALDPIIHNLLFERFLNLERVSVPDLDLDFAAHRRGEIIHYLMNRYGEDRIIGIMSFGTMGARAALRDVARAIKVNDYVQVGDRIAKMVPMGEDNIDVAVKGSQYLQDEQDRMPRLFDMARKVIGKPRSASVHPAGIVIAPSDMSNLVPLYFGSKSMNRETSVCQWDMYDINDLGFLKVDILGLNTVSILDRVMKRLAAKGIEFDLNTLPLDDKRAIGIFNNGETTGLFQLERKYVQELCRRMGVHNFLDVVYLNAIIRPGTADAGTIDHYIKRRNGEEEVVPIHPSLADVLKDGCGFPIFQEDIMKMVQVFSGFTLGGADELRRVVGKKQLEKMPAVEKSFVEGASRMGHTEEEAKTVFSYIKTFAGYGFCRCLSGDTEVYRASKASSRQRVTIGHLYKTRNENGYAKNNNCIPLRHKLRAYGYGEILARDDDGRIRPRKIKDIHFNGVVDVVKIKLENGMESSPTLNHRFMMGDESYRLVSDMMVGDLAMVDGGVENITRVRKHNGITNSEHRELCKRRYKVKKFGFHTGSMNPAYVDGEHAKMMAIKNAMKDISECQQCGLVDPNMEMHHVDGNTKNNDLSNLIKLCQSCHKKADFKLGKRKKKWYHGHPSATSRIASIESCGQCEVYDVEMDTEEHNFIANGFVSHNSHSACYALISYQGAYLKAHHPLEFMCELLNGEGHGSGDSQVGMYIDEARRMGITILPPSAAVGNTMFEIEGDNAIRFGLSFIKNVSATCVECLAPIVRTKPLTFCEILNVVNMFKVNSRAVTNLIVAGAFDHMDRAKNRDYLLARYNVAKLALTKIKDQNKRESAGVKLRVRNNIDSAINEEYTLQDVPSCDLETTIMRELEVAEAYISHQPTAPWENYFHNTATADVSDIADGFERKRKDLLVGGQVRALVDTVVKKGKNEGKRMIMFELWHKYKTVRCVCFEEVINTLRDPLVQGEVYLFKADKWKGGSLIIKNSKRLSCEKDSEKPDEEEETQCHEMPSLI